MVKCVKCLTSINLYGNSVYIYVKETFWACIFLTLYTRHTKNINHKNKYETQKVRYDIVALLKKKRYDVVAS